jgi:hypothetical protein
MATNSPAPLKRPKLPFKTLWIPAVICCFGAGIVCGALSAAGNPLSELTEKPGRPALFRAIVDGFIGAYHGAALGFLVALCYRLPRIVRRYRHKAGSIKQ